MNKIVQTVWDLARPLAQEQGLEIWDVEYVREAGQWYLRVYIDREGGVGISDCENLSRVLDPILDAADPIPGSYVFEVSSAGAERELKRPGDFERFLGRKVEVRLYQARSGSKQFVGTLKAYENGNVTISAGNGETTFEKEAVAQVRLRVL